MNLARRAVKLHPHHRMASRQTVNHLRRAWIRSVQTLGDKWLLARPIPPKENT